MRRLMNALVLDCKKATFFIEKSNDVPLNMVDKTKLNMHLSMCSGCRNYFKQNRFIERLLKRFAQVSLNKEDTAELENRIIQRIEKIAE